MTVQDGQYRRGRDRDLERLERLVERVSERVGKLERVMYALTGVGSATVVTAIYNLVQNIQQSSGR